MMYCGVVIEVQSSSGSVIAISSATFSNVSPVLNCLSSCRVFCLPMVALLSHLSEFFIVNIFVSTSEKLSNISHIEISSNLFS